MQGTARPRRVIVAYIFFYLTFAAATARAVFTVWNTPSFWFMIGMLGIYLLILIIEPGLVARNLAYLHGMNALQTGIALTLLLFVGNLDYFSLLFITPCTQSILNFKWKTAMYWIVAICLLMVAALLAQFPISESIGYVIIYPTAIFLFVGLSYLAQQAEEARSRSEALLADLQVANQKLKAYAAQAEELATVNERNRLARELHDSVTQIIFGLTLSAQAAKILLERDPARVAAQLDHIQALAQNALAEMRSLIQQLHPNSSAVSSLAERLHKLAAERKALDGLNVELAISGERRLPASVEDGLFRVVQEGLNNIIKHAKTSQAWITLYLEDSSQVSLQIKDAGIGFDLQQARNLPGHLGLTSMVERIEALGGNLVIESAPGKGTCLFVKLTTAQEVDHGDG